MTEIHIPPEVIEAAEIAYFKRLRQTLDEGKYVKKTGEGMRAALTAALQAWPGMHQKNIKDSLYYDGDHSIVLPIIRTEPRT
jgi:hypothetical protein